MRASYSIRIPYSLSAALRRRYPAKNGSDPSFAQFWLMTQVGIVRSIAGPHS